MADWNSLLADEAAPDPGAASPSPARKRNRPSGEDSGRPDTPRTAAREAGGRSEEVPPDRDDDAPGAGTRRTSRGRGGSKGRSGSGTRRSRRQGAGAEDAAPTKAGGAAAAAADPYEQARSIVLRQLTGAARSRRQLADKLAEKQIPADVAAAVLDRFEEVRLIDDAEFARMWVRSRSRTRSLARGALRRELSEKGITGDLADDALAEIDDEDEYQAAVELARRRLPARIDLRDRDQKDKQTRRLVSMLARRGYPPGLAYRAVGEVIGGELEGADEADF
ncbi:Regulatory protein RecX [Arthrobacter saudimassiliensis]|uniref:Regulatory protein RecX n=1 Tax=Arthrobacter saudimassiliensis TaxID=1461584 RepID=A0A078MN14_9MICC|nr:Regulatory protein RecX [Arthrobacter saudimassiliensis]